jgi:hypothetical protein
MPGVGQESCGSIPTLCRSSASPSSHAEKRRDHIEPHNRIIIWISNATSFGQPVNKGATLSLSAWTTPNSLTYSLTYRSILSHFDHRARMQRQPFSPPQKSPELFHPRPQHISQVPMMRSPPPPSSQGSSQPQVNSYGNPYQQPPPGAGGGGAGGFGQNFNFMSDPTAQMGFQVGQHAMRAGQDYVEQNVRPRVSSPGIDTCRVPQAATSITLRHQIQEPG